MTSILTVVAVLFASLVSLSAHAQEDFDLLDWPSGLHLFAGAGPSSTLLDTRFGERDAGIGVHLKTDLSYIFDSRWSLDWSSGADFNKVDTFLFWNSHFTLGIKYRLSKDPIFDIESSYVKLSLGRSPTVVYFTSEKPTIMDQYIDRAQFDGPIVGLTTGMLHKTSSGRVWFHEFTGTIQRLDSFDLLKMEKDVPIVVQHENKSNGMLYGLYLTVGILIF